MFILYVSLIQCGNNKPCYLLSDVFVTISHQIVEGPVDTTFPFKIIEFADNLSFHIDDDSLTTKIAFIRNRRRFYDQFENHVFVILEKNNPLNSMVKC